MGRAAHLQEPRAEQEETNAPLRPRWRTRPDSDASHRSPPWQPTEKASAPGRSSPREGGWGSGGKLQLFSPASPGDQEASKEEQRRPRMPHSAQHLHSDSIDSPGEPERKQEVPEKTAPQGPQLHATQNPLQLLGPGQGASVSPGAPKTQPGLCSTRQAWSHS